MIVRLLKTEKRKGLADLLVYVGCSDPTKKFKAMEFRCSSCNRASTTKMVPYSGPDPEFPSKCSCWYPHETMKKLRGD